MKDLKSVMRKAMHAKHSRHDYIDKLSVRTVNILGRNEIDLNSPDAKDQVRQLLETGAIGRIRNIGKKSITELYNWVNEE